MWCNPLRCTYGKYKINQRVIVSIMMHLGLVNALHHRVTLNIAMTEMIAHGPKQNLTNSCPMYNYTTIENIKGGKFDWPHNVEAMILYAFYVGYIFSQIPGGLLADKIGARHVMGTCMMIGTVITFFYPLAIELGGANAAIVLRALLGLVHGPIFPSISTMLQNWVPKEERGFLGGIAMSGSNLGVITGNLFTAMIIHYTSSWKSPFYFWAIIALIWYVVYLFTIFSYPNTHPFITEEEVEHLDIVIKKKIESSVPWKEIFKSKAVYGLIAAEIGHDYLILSLMTDLPKYLNNVLKMDIMANGVAMAIPYGSIWIFSFLFSFLADWVVNKGYMSVLNVRRWWTAFAAVVSGGFLVVTVYLGCNRTLTIAMYTLAITCHGSIFAGVRVNVNDITRYHGGAIMAIINGIGASMGILGPFLVGYLTPTHAIEEWQKVFWIMFGIQVITTAIYWVLASAQRETWDYTSTSVVEMI